MQDMRKAYFNYDKNVNCNTSNFSFVHVTLSGFYIVDIIYQKFMT